VLAARCRLSAADGSAQRRLALAGIASSSQLALKTMALDDRLRRAGMSLEQKGTGDETLPVPYNRRSCSAAHCAGH